MTLESNEVVHHKNGNYADNRIENLEVMGRRDHSRLHHPANPVPRHLRPARRAYMKEYLKKYRRSASKT